MPNAKDILLDDVHFIFDEIGRFLALENQWLETKSAPPELSDGYLYALPHPTDKKRRVACGQSGMRRLEKLSRISADRAGIFNQVDVRTIRTPLAKSLIRRFVLESREITISQVERALSEAARLAKRSLVTLTHYIPCNLMIAQSPDQFGIGPIRFLNRRAFRSELAQRLWELRAEKERIPGYVGDVTNYYKAFSWTAEVTIHECDEKTSERAAVRAVTQALDCLQLYFGPSHTSRMIVGGPAIHRDHRGRLRLENGKVRMSAEYKTTGEVGFEDDWLKFFDNAEGKYLLALFGSALEAAVQPSLVRPISDRFLDAVSWYGEATREKVLAARLVKYVTALERMLMTDEKDNVTDLISQRVAAFCSDPSDQGDFERWQLMARNAYDLRSKLVHGSLSQRDIQVVEKAKGLHDVVQAGLLNTLAAFGHRGLTSETASRAEIANWFNKNVAYQSAKAK